MVDGVDVEVLGADVDGADGTTALVVGRPVARGGTGVVVSDEAHALAVNSSTPVRHIGEANRGRMSPTRRVPQSGFRRLRYDPTAIASDDGTTSSSRPRTEFSSIPGGPSTRATRRSDSGQAICQPSVGPERAAYPT